MGSSTTLASGLPVAFASTTFAGESLAGQEALPGVCELMQLPQECWEVPIAGGVCDIG